MKWYLPSFAGDFRLEPVGQHAEGRCVLILLKPTQGELSMLAPFMKKAQKKKWTMQSLDMVTPETDRHVIELAAPLAKAGGELVKHLRPKNQTLTGVRFEGGQLHVVEGVGADLVTVVEKAEKTGARAAVSVARPTASCPQCTVGAIEPANEVLQEFLTDEQHADWAKHRAILVRGGYTGRRYLLAHRHTEVAQKIGRICYDMDDRQVLHFHDNFVPPEEEVLAAKLILEHREDWLRNEATSLLVPAPYGTHPGYDAPIPQLKERFKNPFGDWTDGLGDSKFISALGGAALGALYQLGQELL